VAQFFSIALRVLVSLAEAAVILAMFHVAQSKFETIVISALVLIYLAVIGSFSMLGHGLLEKGHQDFARFIEIAKSLHLDTDLYQEALKENREEFQKWQVNFWISSVFRTLFAFFAIVNLVYTVLT
jgi:hypothetical protein